MSVRRFGSWPSFNGKKVVLEDDERLNARVPIHVPEGKYYRVAADTQAIAVIPIRVEGTVVIDGTLVMM